jgi:hypothetical protein
MQVPGVKHGGAPTANPVNWNVVLWGTVTAFWVVAPSSTIVEEEFTVAGAEMRMAPVPIPVIVALRGIPGPLRIAPVAIVILAVLAGETIVSTSAASVMVTVSPALVEVAFADMVTLPGTLVVVMVVTLPTVELMVTTLGGVTAVMVVPAGMPVPVMVSSGTRVFVFAIPVRIALPLVDEATKVVVAVVVVDTTKFIGAVYPVGVEG